MVKRKEERNKWAVDIEKSRRTSDQLLKQAEAQDKTMDEMAVIVSCLVEKSRLEAHTCSHDMHTLREMEVSKSL